MYLFRHGLIILLVLLPLRVQAQDAPVENTERRTVQFNGLGRATVQQTSLGGTLLDTDSTTVENVADGDFVLDLALNAQPNDVTEVQGVLRMRNEFGGFFGEGVALEVRELWARGIVANVVEYRVGDMDVALTPYTLFLPDAEGTVNEPDLFRPQQEVIAYEQFYTGENERRLQGGKVDFGLSFTQVLDLVNVRTFLARTRPTNFVSTPTRFLGGGRAEVVSRAFGPRGTQATLGVNLAYVWDDLKTGAVTTGLRNATMTLDFDVAVRNDENLAIRLVGETGESSLRLKDDDETPIDEDDTFLDIGAEVHLKPWNLAVQAAFVDVGPDFYNPAAQSRRVNFARTKSFYNRIGNERTLRGTTLFDLTRDQALYTFALSDQLMAYDPRFSNVLPYGPATPNRRGLRLEAGYGTDDDALEASLRTAFLREIRGQGTTELKDFRQIRATATLRVDQLAGWSRSVDATLGLQHENTNRGGVDVEQVDLSSNLVELGVAAEVYPRLSLLLGAKLRSASGSDYIPVIEDFNDVRDFPARFEVDDTDQLVGAGMRYGFREDIYLTVQFQHLNYSENATPDQDYGLSQVYVLYSMSF